MSGIAAGRWHARRNAVEACRGRDARVSVRGGLQDYARNCIRRPGSWVLPVSLPPWLSLSRMTRPQRAQLRSKIRARGNDGPEKADSPPAAHEVMF